MPISILREYLEALWVSQSDSQELGAATKEQIEKVKHLALGGHCWEAGQAF